MARTKASVGAKVSSGKSSKARCSVAAPPKSGGSSGSNDKSLRSHSGGNPMCPRETPKWQKPITNFFICKDNQSEGSDEEDGATAGSSKSKPKRNIIQSDDEEDEQTANKDNEENEQPNEESKQTTTDAGINGKTGQKSDHINEETDLNSATNGEADQKATNRVLDETIELEPLNGEDSHKIEEYYSKNDKGKGKGKKTKGKENVNVNSERRNSKRDLEQVISGEESPHVSKKVKVLQ